MIRKLSETQTFFTYSIIKECEKFRLQVASNTLNRNGSQECQWEESDRFRIEDRIFSIPDARHGQLHYSSASKNSHIILSENLIRVPIAACARMPPRKQTVKSPAPNKHEITQFDHDTRPFL